MSVVQKIIHPMRIIALPLTRSAILRKNHSPTNINASSDPALIFYHFQLRSPPDVDARDGRKGKKQGRIKTLVRWASAKAADTWAGFGKAPEGNWKLRIYRYGEHVVDRMDFEELALKSVDPSLGPSLDHPDLGGHIADKTRVKEERKMEGEKWIAIPLLYPSIVHPGVTPSTTPHPSLVQLQTLLADRKPRHRKGFYTWMILAPFTAPFMVVPIIPNLPFFFCVWRSWSHYRAYRASEYLEALINLGAIIPEASEELDGLYAEYDPSKSSSAMLSSSTTNARTTNPHSSFHKSNNSEPERTPSPLLTRSAIPAIISLFSLTGHASADIYRALEQARLRSAAAKSLFK